MVDFRETAHGTAETAPAPDHSPTAKDSEDMATAKRTTAPAFQFYPKDFLTSPKVRRMSLTERGAYITLLCLCWLDGSLPNDPVALSAEVHMTVPRFQRMWAGELSACFVERADGRLVNPRLEKERKVQREFRESQKAKAAKRWDTRRNAAASSRDTARHASGNALQSPICNLQSASTPPNGGESPPPSKSPPIIGKRRLHAAFEGPRVYVPFESHRKFLGLRNHPGAEAELQAWYLRVSDAYYDGPRKNESPGANMLAFWDARYDEEWPPTPSPVRPSKQLPAWAQR